MGGVHPYHELGDTSITLGTTHVSCHTHTHTQHHQSSGWHTHTHTEALTSQYIFYSFIIIIYRSTIALDAT